MAISPSAKALQDALAAYDPLAKDYKNSLIAGGGIRNALSQLATTSDPMLGQLRDSRADIQKRLGTVFSDSGDLAGINDPRIREQLRAQRSSSLGAENEALGGKIADLAGSKDRQVSSLGNVFDALTGAKQFGVTDAGRQVDAARTDQRTADQNALTSKNSAEQRAFEAQQNALNRANSIRTAQIAHSGSGGGGVTLAQGIANPLLAFLAAGGKRTADKTGGFSFFDPKGNPISVEQAASMAPGGTKADLLAGSSNPVDQRTVQQSSGKPPTAPQLAQQTSALSGLQSLQQIQDLLDKGISKGQIGAAKHGITSMIAGANAKQYRNASRNAADVIARLRTGAQINDSEMALYTSFVPGATDDPTTARQKLDTLKFIFTNLAQGTKPSYDQIQALTSGSPDTSGGFPGYSPQ